jgi:hypothetical protein
MTPIRKKKQSRLEIAEVVKTVDLSPISMAGSGDDVRLRVEILRKPATGRGSLQRSGASSSIGFRSDGERRVEEGHSRN